MTRQMMLVGLGLALWAGCTQQNGSASREPMFPRGVQGNWVLKDVHPVEAAEQYGIAQAHFKPDLTFTAVSRHGTQLEQARGTYTYDEWTKQLKLFIGSQQRTYTAAVWFGNELRVEGDMPDGKKVAAVMIRSNLPMPEPRTDPRRSERR